MDEVDQIGQDNPNILKERNQEVGGETESSVKPKIDPKKLRIKYQFFTWA